METTPRSVQHGDLRDTNHCPVCGGHVELSHGNSRCCEDCTVHRGSMTGSGEERACLRCHIATWEAEDGSGQEWRLRPDHIVHA